MLTPIFREAPEIVDEVAICRVFTKPAQKIGSVRSRIDDNLWSDQCQRRNRLFAFERVSLDQTSPVNKILAVMSKSSR